MNRYQNINSFDKKIDKLIFFLAQDFQNKFNLSVFIARISFMCSDVIWVGKKPGPLMSS